MVEQSLKTILSNSHKYDFFSISKLEVFSSLIKSCVKTHSTQYLFLCYFNKYVKERRKNYFNIKRIKMFKKQTVLFKKITPIC